MKTLTMMTLGLGVMLAAGGAEAGKVTMPKKGSFEFTFCVADQAKTLAGGDPRLRTGDSGSLAREAARADLNSRAPDQNPDNISHP